MILSLGISAALGMSFLTGCSSESSSAVLKDTSMFESTTVLNVEVESVDVTLPQITSAKFFDLDSTSITSLEYVNEEDEDVTETEVPITEVVTDTEATVETLETEVVSDDKVETETFETEITSSDETEVEVQSIKEDKEGDVAETMWNVNQEQENISQTLIGSFNVLNLGTRSITDFSYFTDDTSVVSFDNEDRPCSFILKSDFKTVDDLYSKITQDFGDFVCTTFKNNMKVVGGTFTETSNGLKFSITGSDMNNCSALNVEDIDFLDVNQETATINVYSRFGSSLWFNEYTLERVNSSWYITNIDTDNPIYLMGSYVPDFFEEMEEDEAFIKYCEVAKHDGWYGWDYIDRVGAGSLARSYINAVVNGVIEPKYGDVKTAFKALCPSGAIRDLENVSDETLIEYWENLR